MRTGRPHRVKGRRNRVRPQPTGGGIKAVRALHVMEHDRLPDLTDALLDLASLAAQILAHMERWQGQSAPDAPPPERVFRDLLAETPRPVLERHSAEATEAARRILVEAVATIEAEILLVEPPRPRREARHRSQSSRRGR
jgi:hypothetical protein